MLRLEGVCAGYRRLEILHELDLEVHAGEIVALIGANGAGKTTTLRTISGMLTPRVGRILLEDEPIQGLRPDKIVRRGLIHVPQDRALFGRLTVQENLEMGAYVRPPQGRSKTLAEVFDLFPILRDRLQQRADTMSGGQQQMLALGRALMSEPRLLTLDEPSIGLAPNLVSAMLEAVQRIRDSGVTVLLVEQNAAHALRISDRAYVMESGAIAVSGLGKDLIDDARVRSAYLGM